MQKEKLKESLLTFIEKKIARKRNYYKFKVNYSDSEGARPYLSETRKYLIAQKKKLHPGVKKECTHFMIDSGVYYRYVNVLRYIQAYIIK